MTKNGRGDDDGGLERRAGLVEVYRPLFAGEGVTIVIQAIVAFAAGLSEALLLVLVAKLAFSIGGDPQEITGLGPLNAIDFTIDSMFVLATILTLVRFALQALSAHLTARLVTRRLSLLRSETFADYSTASWALQSSFDEAEVQDLLIRTVTKITTAIVVISTSFTTFFSLIALLMSAVAVDPLSALLVVGSGSVLFFALRPLSAIAKRYSGLQLSAGRRFVQSSLEAIGLSLEIRAFGVNHQVAAELAAATEAEAKPIYVSQLLTRVVSAVYQLFALTIVLFGLYAVYEFLDRPLASLGAIVVILVRSMNLASTLQSSYHTAVETAPFAEELLAQRTAFVDSAPSSGEAAPSLEATLVFEDVSYSYAEVEGGPLALEGISFAIEHGEAVGVIGPSGGGKSTLIQLLLRLREPRSGRYLIGGVDTAEIDEDVWFRQVAFVPQDCRTLNGTVMENIRFYRTYLSDDDVIAAAKRAHVHDEILAMPEGYQTDLGSRGGSLSGGQRQRVAIARALAANPQILVLDEPTSALDMRSESLVHATLTELQGSVTMLIIAHRLSTLNTCDRIIVLGEGHLQAFGIRSELEDSNAFYRDAIALSKLRS